MAFEAYGRDYDELFENAGLAIEEATVKLESVKSTKKHTIYKKGDSVENLLFSFLEELVFLKDARLLVFNRIKCGVAEVLSGMWEARVELQGEKIDPEKHKLGVDVKAVTKHLFEIKKLSDGSSRCLVVLDV